MILQTIGRWLWIAIAFCLSAFGAVVALFIMGTLWAGESLREIAESQGDPLIWDGSDMFGALIFVTSVAPALTAVPAIAAVLTGELFHIRSGLFYTLAGGAAVAAIPLLAGSPDSANRMSLPPADYMSLFASAGFAGGFFYWLIAGRNA